MRIPVRVGVDFFGHLQQEDGSVIATRCAFVNYLPIVPMGTYRLSAGKAASEPFSVKSLFAAMFKAWGFLAAGGLAAYGLAWGNWERHHDLPFATAGAGVLFALVFASWLFLGHRARSGTRWAVVSCFAVLAFGTLSYGAWFNVHESARKRAFLEGDLPKADVPFGVAALKVMPGAPPDGIKQVEDSTPLEKGTAVMIDVPGGSAVGKIEGPGLDGLVDVTTPNGGAKVFHVARERLYLIKK